MWRLRVLIFLLFLNIFTLTGCSRPYITENDSELRHSEVYKHLIIEIISFKGFTPSLISIDLIKNRIAPYIDKPSGVTVVVDTPIDPREYIGLNGLVWSMKDILDIEKQYSKCRPTKDTWILRIVSFAGIRQYDMCAGVCYSKTSIALFNTTSNSDTEKRVLLHEFGHLLRLVNYGRPVVNNHEDPNHEYHCKNDKCAMYWQVINPTANPDFCDECKKDLLACSKKEKS